MVDGYSAEGAAAGPDPVPTNEKNAETLIQERLRERGWDLRDFSSVTQGFRRGLGGEEADFAFLLQGNVICFLEAKRAGSDLLAALQQAKTYARAYANSTGQPVNLVFSSDGAEFYRQDLRANTLPERIAAFPTPAELREYLNPQAPVLFGQLRDYQRVAVSQVLASCQSGRRRMYLQMATGSGKTVTAAGAIAKLWSVGLLRNVLFLVDRDSLADQTERQLRFHLGDNLTVRRADGERGDRFADVLVATVQFIAYGDKFASYPADHFDTIILDECHRSYFGDWHGTLQYFVHAGARLIGFTATPSDKETQNTDRYFTDSGQYRGPIFRYTIRQGEADGVLAQCHHFKFFTNVDLHGVHDMGFDFEPTQLGRAVDIPARNRLIADRYFDVIGRREPVKTIVFAASIRHASALRYALIAKYNELNNLLPTDAHAEDFIVAIHNEVRDAPDLIRQFQEVEGPIKIAVGVGMLDTGIDAPDVECILMARPTKSKILYVQMKGRGTRKCEETGKDFYTLVDFVDLARFDGADELVTNDTISALDRNDEPVTTNRAAAAPIMAEEPAATALSAEQHVEELVILDIPVTIESSEVIAPPLLADLKRQLESQLTHVIGQEALRERFAQAVLCWQYFKSTERPDHAFLRSMGFDVHALRDLYGEPSASIDDFVEVVLGRADFDQVRRERRFEKWALTRELTREQREIVRMLSDFRRLNPELTVSQLLNSQWLDYLGGAVRVERLFGSFDRMSQLSEEGSAAMEGEHDEDAGE